MNQEFLNTIMTAVVIPLLIAVSGYLIAYLRKKSAEITNSIDDQLIRYYVNEANEAVLQAVDTMFQTYVYSLKEKGEFTKEAQAEAFNKAKNLALELLSSEAKEILVQVYGDFDLWLSTKIEQLVKKDKENKRLPTNNA